MENTKIEEIKRYIETDFNYYTRLSVKVFAQKKYDEAKYYAIMADGLKMALDGIDLLTRPESV